MRCFASSLLVVGALLVAGCDSGSGSGTGDRGASSSAPASGSVTACGPTKGQPRRAHAIRFDREGKRRWSVELNVGETQDSQAGPLTDGKSVFTSEGDQLRSLAVDDGAERWRVDLHGPVYATWIWGSTLVAVVDQVSPNARFTGVDITTGRTLWDHHPSDDVIGSLAVTDDGGLAWAGRSGVVEVVDIASGHARWNATTPSSGTPTVGAVGDVVIHSSMEALTAYDSLTGAVRWSVPADDHSPFITSNGVVIVDHSGRFDAVITVAIDGRDGTELWHWDRPPNNAFVSPLPSPAGLFLYDSSSKLSLVDVRTGTVRWQQPMTLDQTDPLAVQGAHIATLEPARNGQPVTEVSWRSLSDGSIEATTSLDAHADHIIAGGQDAAIVVTDTQVLAVAATTVWQSSIPEFSEGRPVALEDGGALLQIVDPQITCFSPN